MLVAAHAATLRVDPGHYVSDRAILARGVHRLKDQQQGVAIRCVQQLLGCTEAFDVLRQQRLLVLGRLVYRRYPCRPLAQLDLLIGTHAKIVRVQLQDSPALAVDATDSSSCFTACAIINSSFVRITWTAVLLPTTEITAW